MNVNILAEICALFISIFIFAQNKLRTNNYSLQYNYFNKLTYILLFKISSNLLRHIINIVTIKYLFTLIFHSLTSILFAYFLLYCFSFSPNIGKIIKKIEVFFNFLSAIIIFIIISSPFSKLVYYIKDGEIVKGKLVFISFFIGYICVIAVTYFLFTQKISKRAKRDILLLNLIIFIPSFIELLNSNLVLNGFGCAFGLLFILESFHGTNYDTYYEVSKDDLLFKKFKYLTNKQKEFSLIVVDFLNLDYLSNKAFTINNNCNSYIINIFRNCENLISGINVFSWNNKFFIIKEENSISGDDFIEILEKEIVNSDININIGKLEYKILYMETPNMIKKLKYLDELYFNEQVHKINEKDIENLNYKLTLIREIKDIFAVNDYHDPRIEVFYQPIYDYKNKKFLSAEALSRLNIKSLGGLVFPDKFISILEDREFIHKFTLIVLNKVCMYIKQLELNNVEFEGISVNFSLKEFLEPNFENDILDILKNHNVNPEKIHIEITESIEAQNMNLIKNKVMNLKEKGFKFYLDDFGTGYSNLSEIVEIPFNVIKFDKSLLDKSLKNNTTKDITNGMVKLFASKDLNILFEGVENKESEKLALNFGAVFLQGYKYSKPIKAKDAFEFFGKNLSFIEEKKN